MVQRGVRDLSDLQFSQCVFEVRYPKAHKYWDDCGKTIETIEQRIPGLKCLGLEPQGFRFSGSKQRGVSNALFYWDKIVAATVDGGPEQNEMPKRFPETAAEFVRLVAQQLSIQSLSFVGNRFWFLVPFSESAAAEHWLREQHLWQFARESPNLGVTENETLRLRTRIGDRTLIFRIGSGELKAEGITRTGVIVDFDVQLREPPGIAKLDADAIIKGNLRIINQFAAALFNG